jgi:hypothetical protein
VDDKSAKADKIKAKKVPSLKAYTHTTIHRDTQRNIHTNTKQKNTGTHTHTQTHTHTHTHNSQTQI